MKFQKADFAMIREHKKNFIIFVIVLGVLFIVYLLYPKKVQIGGREGYDGSCYGDRCIGKIIDDTCSDGNLTKYNQCQKTCIGYKYNKCEASYLPVAPFSILKSAF